ncbi:MAG: hypothetical protein ACTHJT_16125, partial [Cytophaga sp.]|uniref:hypothetical protein n=1 Tax=Cytophaga sp. TaxID=29535 RepID=UPI003F7F61D5
MEKFNKAFKNIFVKKCLVVILLLLFDFITAKSQVIVTSAGNVNMCVGGSFVSIPDIKIAEKNKTDFAISANVQTYELNAPLNFEFNAGVGNVIISASTDISFADLNVTPNKITLNYLLNTTTQKDSFILRGIQVHAINTTSSGDLLFTGGTASQNQNNKNQYVHAHFESKQANVDLTVAQKVVCANAADLTLNGSPSGGNYTISESNTSLVGSIFRPSISGPGLFVLTYTANQNGCVSSDTVHITVKPIPAVNFSGMQNSYCSNDADVTLTGFPSGGVFSGNGVSGNTFKPNTLLPGITSVTYSYTNSVGCPNVYTQSGINILQAPSVTIALTPDQSIYPTTSTSVSISGTQTNPSFGGIITLSGNGVSNITNMFYPSVTGVGTFDITRTLVAPNGCTASASKTITVATTTGLYINGLLPKYCVGDGIYGLSSNGGVGKFTGPGITDVDEVKGTANFSPDGIIFSGQDTMITIFCDYSDLDIMVFQYVRIFNKPKVLIQQDTRQNAIGFRTDFCRNDAAVQLTTSVSPTGGTTTYSGVGVEFISSAYMFNPKIASSVNTVTVKYTDLNGCINTDSKIVNVNAIPVPYFTISSYCEGDVIHLKDSASVVLGNGVNDVINNWKWQVDNSIYNNQNIDLVLPAGNHTIKYTLTTQAGCSESVQKSTFIGPYPNISFSWDKVCNGDVTKFSNATSIPNGTGWIDTIVWNFVGIKDTIFKASNHNPSVNYWNYNYKFLSPGVYTVTQTAITNNHCKSIDSQKVFIFPMIDVSIDIPYANDFQTSQGGWIPSTAADTASSWAWGFANKSIIKSRSNNDFVWATNLSGSYKMNEHSYVYSPCFVLDDLDRPMIHMDIWSATRANTSGANLQYTLNGKDWETLGNTKSGGINWYNNGTNISSRPSGPTSLNQNGWTGTDSTNGWKNVRYVLDDVIDKNKQIRFRVSFAGTNQKTDGFAFDNVWIGNRIRLILVENFTNNTSINAKTEDASLDDLITANLTLDNQPSDIVELQYHAPYPGIDQINQRNAGELGARALYYGLGNEIP